MDKRPTEELDRILEQTAPDQIGDYFLSNRKDLADTNKAFCYYFKDVIDAKHIMLKDVYARAGLTESYGSKIVSMEKHTKNRDVIIRLCLAGHFTLDEMNRALKLYGFNELYSKNPRDACMIVALNNRICDADKINEILKANGLKEI